MTTPPRGPGLVAGDIPGWQPWISSTGRWWAACQHTLTRRQLHAGCQPLVYGSTQEELATRIRDQETLRTQHPAQPPGTLAGPGLPRRRPGRNLGP